MKMKTRSLPGLSKTVSRLVLGVCNQLDIKTAAPQFDAFVEAGGTTFDTAWVYGNYGGCEKTLGEWLSATGSRETLVIVGKGGHTPWCNRDDILKHLDQSLQRLQTSYVDIYMLHRDNPELPASELIDVFDEIHRAGKATIFGVSNWTIKRIQEANSYAASTGKPRIEAVSNNFSLARMIEAPWEGCVSATDDESRDWFTRHNMPLLAWSSQAHGFFAGFARPEHRDPEHLARCWYSDENLERLQRAEQLAAMLSKPEAPVSAVNIALAYVLAQPFPTWALIGPRTTDELANALRGLEVELTQPEVEWLDLRSQTPLPH